MIQKLFLYSICLHSTSIQGSFNALQIFNDSALYDTKGYNMNDPRVNGEYYLAKHLIDDKTIIFDIGANWGDWSKFALSLQKDIALYVFEPIPTNFLLLQRNLNLPKVYLYNIALDNTVTMKNFFVYENPITKENAGSSLHDRPGLAQYKKIIQVPTNTLDAFCEEHAISHIDFVKIDTEGNELFILQGAKTLVARHAITFIQLEYGGTYPDAGTTLKEVYDFLTNHNYTLFRILPKELVKINKWRPELENNQYSNYLAVAPIL